MFQFPLLVPFRRRRHRECEEDVEASCDDGEVKLRRSLNAFRERQGDRQMPRPYPS